MDVPRLTQRLGLVLGWCGTIALFPLDRAAAQAPAMGVDDWVQAHGAFWFVRVRNRSTQTITVSDGAIENCANVGAGCGTIDRHLTIAPDSTATLAAVAGRSAETPSFTYHYQAHLRGYAYAGSGTSHKRAPSGAAPISSHELSLAEAPLLAQLHAAAPPVPVAAPAAPPPAAQTHPAPPPEVITPEPEPTPVETPVLRPIEPTPAPAPRATPARVYRRLTRLQPRPTPTPTPEPPRPHSFQHWLPRGLQHWLIR